MSLGWIIVVIIGFIPLALVFLTGNNSARNNQQRNNQSSSSSSRNNKNNNNSKNRRKHAYTGWRIVLTGDSFLSIQDTKTSIEPNSLSLIQRLAQECELFIVSQVNTDAKEDSILDCLRNANDTDSTSSSTSNNKSICDSGLSENKILFCETQKGIIAIARQLEPDLFVGTDASVTKELSRFLPNVSHIDPPAITLNTYFEALENK
jgi:hypothetical protein